MDELNHHPTHVLLAEDDDEDYLVFSLALKDLPFAIVLTRAENGEVLNKMLEEKHPDIIFLDLLMPCKGGHQCLPEIRSRSEFDSIPIIIYSSLYDMQDIEFCYRLRSNFYAIKPSSMVELKHILTKIFSVNWKKMIYLPPLSEFVINP